MHGLFNMESESARIVGSKEPVGGVLLSLEVRGDPTGLGIGLGRHLLAVRTVETLPFDGTQACRIVMRGFPVTDGDHGAVVNTPVASPAPAPAPLPLGRQKVEASDLSGPGIRALLARAGIPDPPASATRADLLAAVAPLFS